jgi:hypothetical protein
MTRYNELKHTLPVAPQQASLASSITTLFPLARSSSAKKRAMDDPVKPLPTITTSAVEGKSGVVRWPSRKVDGSECQKEDVEEGVGREERTCFMVGSVLQLLMASA